MDFFQNIKVRGGEKNQIKISKSIFLFNVKNIWIGGNIKILTAKKEFFFFFF